jgi:hypothetical protein
VQGVHGAWPLGSWAWPGARAPPRPRVCARLGAWAWTSSVSALAALVCAVIGGVPVAGRLELWDTKARAWATSARAQLPWLMGDREEGCWGS